MIFRFVLGPTNFCELDILTANIERATRDHGDRRTFAQRYKISILRSLVHADTDTHNPGSLV